MITIAVLILTGMNLIADIIFLNNKILDGTNFIMLLNLILCIVALKLKKNHFFYYLFQAYHIFYRVNLIFYFNEVKKNLDIN